MAKRGSDADDAAAEGEKERQGNLVRLYSQCQPNFGNDKSTNTLALKHKWSLLYLPWNGSKIQGAPTSFRIRKFFVKKFVK